MMKGKQSTTLEDNPPQNKSSKGNFLNIVQLMSLSCFQIREILTNHLLEKKSS
jgi:hypothetical protein